MKNVSVKLTNVSKKYTLHHEKPTLVENILARKKEDEFWALNNINLSIMKGEKVGIIGPNGSGKTTLLKIISGITTPTTGVVLTRGKVVSLIELSAGFQPDLTGEENILLNGLLIGMIKKEIRKKMGKIIKFAGVGKFIDAPFYTYSSGMALRLGFSIAIYANPDILVLDEHLSVGDQEFQIKSYNKIVDLYKKGKTILNVSQHAYFINKFCNKVILLKSGKIKKSGSAKQVAPLYFT